MMTAAEALGGNYEAVPAKPEERGPQNPVHSAYSITFNYRNYRGEVAERRVHPIKIWYGLSDYHLANGAQWFLQAYDPTKGEDRDFALNDIIGSARIEEKLPAPKEDTMILDESGRMIRVGDIVAMDTEKPFQEMHGTWCQYVVEKAPAGYRLGYWLSQKGQVLPKGYSGGYMSDHIMDAEDKALKQMIFSTVPVRSRKLRVIGLASDG